MRQKLDRITKLIVEQAKERGDNIKICCCGGVHIWKKGVKAKIIPMGGQPCLMIVEKEKK